jgi:hypothetical protein
MNADFECDIPSHLVARRFLVDAGKLEAGL